MFTMNLYSKQLLIKHPHTQKERLFSIEYIAKICHVSERTVERWKKSNKIPPASMALIRVYGFGDIPHPDWQKYGYSINERGELCCTDHQQYWTAGELNSLYAYIKHARAHDKRPPRKRPATTYLKVIK